MSADPRTIAVVTGARSEYGIYRPILKALRAEPGARLRLLACGMHLSREFGHTVELIERDGFKVAERIETLLSSDTPEAIGKSMALGVAGFAQSYARDRPDLLLVLGDRYEMFAAVAAALPFALPVAHVHGGESTEGLIDEAIRHSITKMSHLHFVTTEAYSRRVAQLGEDPSRVFVTGAPSLDNLKDCRQLGDEELSRVLGLPLDPAPLIATFHPVTLEYERTADHVNALLAALEGADRPIVFTYPNADTAGRVVIEGIERFVARHPRARALPSLGTDVYFALLARAAAMIGNSSSGIIEAASFELPVVDIGNRQRGRIRGANVLHAEPGQAAISAALHKALDPGFRRSLKGLVNLYGDGHAAERIARILVERPLDQALLEKRFHDLAR